MLRYAPSNEILITDYIRASKRIYILVIGQTSSFANILPANWFRLAYSPIFYPSNIFPRTVLQDLSKIFDPLGFVAPVVVRAKILMQKLWQCKIAWDEPLSEDHQTEWKDIAINLKEATGLSVRRCYFTLPTKQPVVHCFADASPRAYGAVVFLTQQNQVSFVTAKSRVAPLKQLTLPRLELMAALVATRLTHFAQNAIPLQDPSVFIWSDSKIVLQWIKTQKQLQAFVHHRITEIRSLLPNATWRYCPTLENPVDLLTRGITTQSLLSSTLWQRGPEWLTTPDQWPTFQQPPLTNTHCCSSGGHCVCSNRAHPTRYWTTCYYFN